VEELVPLPCAVINHKQPDHMEPLTHY